VSDLEIVKNAIALCRGTYALFGDPAVAWSYFEPGVGTEGVCFGIVQTDESDDVTFRGTADLAEWFDDFDFVAAPTVNPKLGDVHDGFLLGMPEAWQIIKSKRRPGKLLRLYGHSLGSSRANVCCKMAILDGDVPDARVVCGEPYTGFASFCAGMESIRLSASLCNGDAYGHDLVCEVPFPLPPRWPWIRQTPLLHVSAAPNPDEHSAFRYHHIQLYDQAALELTAMPVPLTVSTQS
jgi:hypothetical protein